MRASFDDVTPRPPTSLFSGGNGWRLRRDPRAPTRHAGSVSANFLALALPPPRFCHSDRRCDYNIIILAIYDASRVVFLIFSRFFYFLNYNLYNNNFFCLLCTGRITRCQQPESLSTSPSTSSEGAFSCRSSPSPPLSESSSSAAWSGRGLPSVVDEGIGLTDDDFEDVPKRKKVSSTCYTIIIIISIFYVLCIIIYYNEVEDYCLGEFNGSIVVFHILLSYFN